MTVVGPLLVFASLYFDLICESRTYASSDQLVRGSECEFARGRLSFMIDWLISRIMWHDRKRVAKTIGHSGRERMGWHRYSCLAQIIRPNKLGKLCTPFRAAMWSKQYALIPLFSGIGGRIRLKAADVFRMTWLREWWSKWIWCASDNVIWWTKGDLKWRADQVERLSSVVVMLTQPSWYGADRNNFASVNGVINFCAPMNTRLAAENWPLPHFR